MNCLGRNLFVGMVAALAAGRVTAQIATFTSQFPIDDCHFSTFGGQPHFILNPGHQRVLRGEEFGEQKEVTITSLNATKEITLSASGKTRKILTRVVEEREKVNGVLTEVGRFWYARCVETGDVYFFGEEVDLYENGGISSQSVLWEAGVDGALPGIIMPRTFMLGARYFQEQAPGFALDQAENVGMGLTIVTTAGTFENCVQVKEYDGLRPGVTPAVKTYAPGIGLINDDDLLKLAEFHLGKTAGLPGGCTFVPFSNHPFFPFSPGRQLVLEGQEDGEQVVLTISVLDQIREISLMVDGEARVIPTRVIEERETKNGELAEVSRNFFAQCVETGDVYYFGEEVDVYAGGEIVGHGGTWLAGVGNAQPGIMMPGSFVVGARYAQEMAPGVAMDLAVNSAAGITSTVPAGTFTGCVRVTETNPLVPGEDPSSKTYAPGIGLISDDASKLTAFTDPNAATGLPVLSIQDSILLIWPLMERAFRVESSSNLTNWLPVPQTAVPVDGRYQMSVPRNTGEKFFRLSTP